MKLKKREQLEILFQPKESIIILLLVFETNGKRKRFISNSKHVPSECPRQSSLEGYFSLVDA